ncbi:RsmB/NOP family class I SAM-dependent RNA methyltransferase [Bartonella sp. HY038]|uniref:RsmB/NOP family class I SAM-dependent RNA methyltransferase n=1 Tax=Bartonella sp. HY038 TaxID=2759660 RepID=UPI0015FCEC53|nr:RsmB/NOP family class I SAM-dependent RNA methyltransferase [Bartonella sp. HY038]
MRLGGRLQAAIEVLKDIETRKRPAADALKDWGLSHRFAGSGDRAAIGNIVYDALRRRLSIAYRMGDNSIEKLAFGALMSEGGMNFATLDAALHDDRFAPEQLDGNTRNHWQNANIADAADYIQADIPQWSITYFQDLFGVNWIKEAAALGERPPLDLRVNSLKSNRERVLKELAETHAQPVDWYDEAIRIAPIEGLGRHPNVQAEPAFQKGWFEVQDLGSQIAAHLVDANGHEQILDYCAGAGGKTMALAAQMDNRGQIHAYDAEKSRLAPIFDRLRRAGVRNSQAHANLKELTPLKGQMDCVLVDAPCTGTGTWRRRPDAKWRLTETQLERRVEEQRQVLDNALEFVKDNGRLVYITCSLFAPENDEQITSLLAREPNLQKIDMQDLWQKRMSAKSPAPHFSKHGIVLSPKSTQTDGFYISVLEKKA